MRRMSQPHVLGLHEVDRTQVGLVGGKAANLGELSRLEGIRVPAGFAVTTRAFQRFLAGVPAIQAQLERISRVKAEHRAAIHDQSLAIRQTLEAAAIPVEVSAAITRALGELGDRGAYAVRSSATAEDLPTASFAGQQDTYLNVVGPEASLEHVRRCWASLYTERAVTYRSRNGFDQRKVSMAVIVQRMVPAQAAGILFTADPVTGNRKVSSIEASFGLGEALVSGLVNPDVYKVQGERVVATVLAPRQAPRAGALLTERQALELSRLGRRIEAHFGCPQDIEWCAADGLFHFVQSRPITTLFPVPAVSDGENHVYVSVGHQQMMTHAMKPLGLSVWQLTTARQMAEAGGRLFVDVTRPLSSPESRKNLLDALGKSDPLIRDALQTLVDRGDFITEIPDAGTAWAPPGTTETPLETDPAIPAELVARSQASIATLEREIAAQSGPALFDFILADIQELRRISFEPRSMQVILAAMQANWWLNEQLQAWLGEKNAADTLTQSVPHNVTSEMGLALLEVADVIRPHPELVTLLERVEDDGFLEALPSVAGGREAQDAIQRFLDRYGMRCGGEIDITRPRWSERPSTLVPALLGNIKNFQPGEGKRRFEQGCEQAQQKEREILERLRRLPDGAHKADEAKRRIDRVRTFAGYREYPKYGMVSRYFAYKQALLKEAERLVAAGVLREIEDIYYLRFEELRDVVRTQRLDQALVRERKQAFRTYEALTPPRVLTSDGEALTGEYRREALPPGALVGLPVSSGSVEGRARVILEMAQAELQPGDILVTTFTDPSWTPLFVAIQGLVTEVGGLMTHGAVIAREYGLPAVVGVEGATRLIRDGQRIRVHGTDGFVEILS